MQVKTLKPHGNGHGAKFFKARGDTYALPAEQAKPLIAARLVSEVKPEAKADTAGTGAGGTKS